MGDLPVPYQRGRPRTVALVLISTVVPTLGLILGGIEIAFGSYRFGTLLILLAIVSSFALVAFIEMGG